MYTPIFKIVIIIIVVATRCAFDLFRVFQGRKRYGRGLSGRQHGVRWIGAQVAKICWATRRCWWLQVFCTGRRNSVQTLAVRPDSNSPANTPFSSSSPQSSQLAARTGKPHKRIAYFLFFFFSNFFVLSRRYTTKRRTRISFRYFFFLHYYD